MVSNNAALKHPLAIVLEARARDARKPWLLRSSSVNGVELLGSFPANRRDRRTRVDEHPLVHWSGMQGTTLLVVRDRHAPRSLLAVKCLDRFGAVRCRGVHPGVGGVGWPARVRPPAVRRLMAPLAARAAIANKLFSTSVRSLSTARILAFEVLPLTCLA